MPRHAEEASPGRDQVLVEWLLEPDQPAVRYRTLVDLLGRRESDPEVRAARSKIARTGWAHDQLRQQGPHGIWERRDPKNAEEWINFLYYPKYLSSNWRALVLADLGLQRTNPAIRRLAEQIFAYKLRLSSLVNFYHEEACASANTARMLTRFGYGDDFRVRKLFDWLLEDQRENGGWNCAQDAPGTLDVWEPLAAFAALPRAQRSPRIERAVERGIEFYLDRKLMQEGQRYPPWLRLHYPNHYFYDFLIGLDLATELGFADDRRLRPALDLLRQKRHADGTWWIDRAHPDVSGPKSPQYRRGVTPLIIEPPGRPSKWITLKALRVLQRVDRAS